MRNDERLRTIYEVMAPYIVRNEHNWRDYLAFASQFHKHSFDNILLVYAQDEDVSILATRKQWAAIGRNLIPRAKGVAVCVYRNAKLTLDYLFDVSQTTGKEIHPTDWQLSDEMKKALTERLSYAHGFPKQDFPQALYAMASESVAENYNHFLQELKQETKGHLFTEIPAGGFEAQYIQLLTDSISYFIGKKCHLPDEEIQLSDGMATVSHFNTLPLVAHLGTAVTALSKGILLEVERNIKIINRERMAQHEQTEYQSEIQGAGRDDASRSANLQQQRSRSTSGQVRPDGPGIPQRESPGAIYDFENGWQSDGDHAPGTGRGDREDRSPDAANAPAGAASADRGHHGADATPEQSETDGGGNRTPERSPDSPLTEEQVLANAETYKRQVFKILDPEKTLVEFNSRWLGQMSAADFIRLASHCTVARMLERDDFEKRYREQRAISIHEFMYPLCQGYDSVALKTDVEMGGTDQKFNLLMGRNLQAHYGQESQCILTMPLLEGTDGVRKMSKSYGNYIGIDEAPSEIFGKVMAISDELMWRYYELLSSKSLEDIAALRAGVENGSIHPKAAKEELAHEMVTRYHSRQAADEARQGFNAVFAGGGVPDDAPTFTCAHGENSAPSAFLADAGLVKSRGEAKRLIKEGALSIDGQRCDDALSPLAAGEYVIKLGKKRFLRLTVEG